MKKFTLWRVAAICLLAFACQAGKTIVLGNPTPTGHTVQEVHAAKLASFFGRYQGTYIGCDAEFVAELHTSPVENYRALVARHEFGTMYVLIREGLYGDVFPQLKRGAKLRVYGTVTSAQTAAEKAPRIAVQVDE